MGWIGNAIPSFVGPETPGLRFGRSFGYEPAVRVTWRHYDLSDASQDHVNLVRYATLAASSHNTQPWKFRLERGRISILPDLSRRCPEVDPDDHHLFASIGCAAENLLLAAQAAGLRGHLSYDASASGVQVDLEPAPPSRSALFEAMPRRQCSRAAYDGAELPAEQLRLLEDAGRGTGVSIVLLTGKNQKEQIAEYVTQGNAAQIGDPRWVDELRAWVRDAVRAGDGLYGRVMGNPDVPRWLGNRLMRFTLSAKAQKRKDVKNIRSSAGVAVFFSEFDDRLHWTEAGGSTSASPSRPRP